MACFPMGLIPALRSSSVCACASACLLADETNIDGSGGLHATHEGLQTCTP
jgi:hypothetical protein